MELIVISSSKLKIMLSADDMFKYDLGTDIDYANSKTRRAFRSILEEAREKTGFDAENEKIFIQLYPSKKGGCEVYITKIDEETDGGCAELSVKLAEEKSSHKPNERSLGIIPAQKRRYTKERRRAYSFSELSHLSAVCRRLLCVGWKGQSGAYSDENGRFYLIIKDKYTADPGFLDRLAFIFEYGNAEHHDSLIKYLGEHATCICPSSAVEKLGEL